MTRKGKIIYWSITFVLAFLAISLRSLLLDLIFFALNMLILVIVRHLCPKPDEPQEKADQTSDPKTENNQNTETVTPISTPQTDNSELEIRKCTGNCSTCERDTCIEEQEK